DLLMAEALERQAQEMREELTGPQPTPLESMLVEMIINNWLELRQAEYEAVSHEGGTPAQAQLRMRRADVAQRKYLGALKTLATIRTLLSRGTAPVPNLRLFA